MAQRPKIRFGELLNAEGIGKVALYRLNWINRILNSSKVTHEISNVKNL